MLREAADHSELRIRDTRARFSKAHQITAAFGANDTFIDRWVLHIMVPDLIGIVSMNRRFHVTLRQLSCSLFAAMGCLSQVSLASAAPAQLYNKSVKLAWIVSASGRGPDGKTSTAQIENTRTVYVSGAGRLFIRGAGSFRGRGPQLGRQKEIAPGGGSAGTLAFQGNQLVGTAQFEGAAQRVVVSFDPGFTSCNASVVIGKLPGTAKWVAYDNVTYEILSANVGTVSCSISEGNALAN